MVMKIKLQVLIQSFVWIFLGQVSIDPNNFSMQGDSSLKKFCYGDMIPKNLIYFLFSGNMLLF